MPPRWWRRCAQTRFWTVTAEPRPGDRSALISIVRRISALIDIVPEVTELDLNPVKVLAPGKGAIVIDARMRVAPLRGLH